MFGVSNSLLRYWESEFETINPGKNKKGDRRYAQKDIEAVAIVYQLVKDMGFTIEGARNEIRAGRQAEPGINHLAELRKKLTRIRTDLLDLEKKI